MDERRPDPDALLRRIEEKEKRARRGRLKVFFGAAPGVGKTYSMLESARGLRQAGADPIVGWVDTHGRQETQALLQGLELLPHRTIQYRGITIEEFDVDTALARRPALILLDELAHTNAEGSRHRKRWQDVMELLDAGIGVWTTLNVQHIESLNDVVAQITTVRVRETVPDSVLEQADEIELVDLPPEALLERLREGKVYLPEQAQRAVSHFFRRGNLLALRELALRRTAERVDAEVRAYRIEHGIEATWPATERILVCVGPGPHAARLVRAARRMAAGLRADWTAVYVEIPAHARLPQDDRDWVIQHLRLAESLGGRIASLSGDSVAQALLAYAREHNATKILVGKPTHPRWRDLLRGSLLDEIIRGSGDIEVYVSSGDRAEGPLKPPPVVALQSPASSYLLSIAAVAAATALAFLLYRHVQLTDLILVYLLTSVWVAARLGRGPALLAATLGVAAFDVCFVPPRFSFSVTDIAFLPTFGVVLVVSFIVSTLAASARERAEAARSQAEWIATLHAFSRELAQARDLGSIGASAVRQIEAALGGSVAVLVAGEDGALRRLARGTGLVPDQNEAAVARWVFDHRTPAGLGTDTLPGASALYLPLEGAARTLGVLVFCSANRRPLVDPKKRQMLEAMTQQAAGAMERALLAEESKQVELRARAEELRSSLLSSVSHDLRTPLATIVGSATTLLGDEGSLRADQRTDLIRAIHEEGEHLNRLVTNLLAMTRLESGSLTAKKEWIPLEEVVGAALERVRLQLGQRPVEVRMPPDFPLLPVDPTLIEQLIVNLVENAVRHTPAGSPIELGASHDGRTAILEVRDRGPGLPPGSEKRVFEKFYRGPTAAPGGSGLGLAICRGIAHAHGGTIEAENRLDGGLVIRVRVPIEGEPPPIPGEEPSGAESSAG